MQNNNIANPTFALLNHTFESKTGESIDALDTLRSLQSGKLRLKVSKDTNRKSITVVNDYVGTICNVSDQQVIAECRFRDLVRFTSVFAKFINAKS